MNRRKIVRCLAAEGWVADEGREHTLFTHSERAGVVVVPRRTTLTPGVARSIARVAGWR